MCAGRGVLPAADVLFVTAASAGAAASGLPNGRQGVAPAPRFQLYVRCAGSCRAPGGNRALCLVPRWHRGRCDVSVVWPAPGMNAQAPGMNVQAPNVTATVPPVVSSVPDVATGGFAAMPSAQYPYASPQGGPAAQGGSFGGPVI